MANNPNPQRETDRALYVALVDWVVKSTLPPPSEYPRVGDGTLVPNTSAAMGWPAIPNAPRPDGVVNPVLDYDYGPAFRYNDNSGVVANVPPPSGASFRRSSQRSTPTATRLRACGPF